VLSSGSAETNVGLGGKLNGHFVASCVRNIFTKNYQNLIIGFHITLKNVRMFFETHVDDNRAGAAANFFGR